MKVRRQRVLSYVPGEHLTVPFSLIVNLICALHSFLEDRSIPLAPPRQFQIDF